MDLDNLDNLISDEELEELKKKQEEQLKRDEISIEDDGENCDACNI